MMMGKGREEKKDSRTNVRIARPRNGELVESLLDEVLRLLESGSERHRSLLKVVVDGQVVLPLRLFFESAVTRVL